MWAAWVRLDITRSRSARHGDSDSPINHGLDIVPPSGTYRTPTIQSRHANPVVSVPRYCDPVKLFWSPTDGSWEESFKGTGTNGAEFKFASAVPVPSTNLVGGGCSRGPTWVPRPSRSSPWQKAAYQARRHLWLADLTDFTAPAKVHFRTPSIRRSLPKLPIPRVGALRMSSTRRMKPSSM